MIVLKGDWEFCNVNNSVVYGSDGQPYIEYTINPGPWKEEVESKLAELSGQLTVLLERDLAEIAARQSSPTLQDAWDKYQTLLKLTQEHV